MSAAQIVAESIGRRFEHGEGLHVGLGLRRVCPPWREWNGHGLTCLFRRSFDGCATAQNDQVSERDLLRAGLVEVFLDLPELAQDIRQLSRLVDFPVLLRREANTCAVRPAAL